MEIGELSTYTDLLQLFYSSPSVLADPHLVSVEYLAGFIDGEGSLALARRRHPGRSLEYSVRVCVYNSHRELLEKIQNSWGGVMSSVGQRHALWKPAYALIWTNAAAADILHAVAPYLRIKSAHAARLLEFQEHVEKCPRTRDPKGHLSSLSKREQEFRKAFHRRLKHLNARGRHRSPRGGGREHQSVCRFVLSTEYLAGFIDGEGSLMIQRWQNWRYARPYYKPRISIANTDRAVLEEIQHLYGGILTNQPPRKVRWRFSYQLVWTDGMVERVLLATRPHLQIKRNQADILLELIRHRRRTRQGRKSPNGRYFAQLPIEVMAFRKRLYLQVKRLNARGRPGLGEL